MKKAKRIAAYLLAIVLIVSQLTCMCGVTAFADGLPSALSDSLLHGVNLHNSGKYAYQSIYSAIMEAKALGSNVVRFNFDPGEDGYSADDLSYVLSVAEILEENDMELVLVLDGFNQIFTDDDDSYTNSVIATNYGVLANRLAGKVAYYQIGNEIDNYYEQYSSYNFASKAAVAQKAASALKAARTAIKGADSSAKFILNFGWTHYDFLDAIYDLGYEWDVTGLDWYSDMSDQTSANFYETVIDTVVNDFETPVIVCETGLTPVDDNGTVDYVSDVEWLCDFAEYCEDNEDVLGFILYELYDEGDPYVNNAFEKENCFGLFDFNKNEKAITPYIRALFGGETNSRVYNPVVPSGSYAASDAAIDTQGVANKQGKLFSWLGDNITHKGLSPVDISGYLAIEFDLYVEDYDSFMIAYDNAGFSNSSGTSSFRFRLLNTASIANNMAIADLDIDQINQSGWNHITVNYNKFDKYSFDPASVTGYDLYIENYGGIQNRNYLNATSGMVFAIANLYATGMDTSGQIPAVSNVYTTVAQLNPGNPKNFSGFDLAYRLGLNQEGLTPVDFSDADYVEFDLYVESKTRLFNAISAIDTADAGVNHRLSLRLSSNSSNCTTDALRIDELPNYIKNDGWNHIVAKYEGDIFGSYDETAVCSWVVSFENTWARGIGTDVSGIIGGNTFVVANICGTKMVGPEMNNVMGESVGSLNENNGLITSGWRFGRYYDAGCYQKT